MSIIQVEFTHKQILITNGEIKWFNSEEDKLLRSESKEANILARKSSTFKKTKPISLLHMMTNKFWVWTLGPRQGTAPTTLVNTS